MSPTTRDYAQAPRRGLGSGGQPARESAPFTPARGLEVESVITIRDLDVSRNRHPILHQVSMEVPAGSIVGLMGPSGCGKTTLMRTIVGVQRLDAGSLTILGHRAGDRALRGLLGYVSQAVSVYTELSVRDNVAYFASLNSAPAGSVDAAIQAVGLTDYATHPINTLSGGQASRASLACALAGDPVILILDEPTVGLDPLTREELWAAFHALADRGHTLVISSHVMDEATRCDRLVLMREGRILAELTPAELLASTGATTPDEAFLRLIRNQEGEDR